MRKRKLALFILSFFVLFTINNSLKSQNLHLFYDFGRTLYKECENRPLFTTTVDLFHADPWGSTFFFVDMDYRNSGIAYAYWEINRELNFFNSPLSLSLEYNGGLTNTFSISNAYLAGVQYQLNNEDFTKGIALRFFYKYIQDNQQPDDFQFTAVWFLNFGQQKWSFLGFADFWREPIPNRTSDFIFLTEPQIWFNFNALEKVNDKFNLCVGSEVKISYNFTIPDKFAIIPTIALKWRFQ